MEDLDEPSLNSRNEIQKLENLVRELELQNQRLKSKHNKESKNNSSFDDFIESNAFPNLNVSNSTGIIANRTNVNDANHLGDNNNSENESCDINENLSYMDDVDLIRLSDVDVSDDDSWLYMSPKGLTPEQKNESPYKWLRKDVDDLENKELQLAKKALIKKLNELEILSPTSQASPSPPVNRTVNQLRKPVVPRMPSPPSEHVHYSSIDTRTFTKSKKKQALEYLSSTQMITNCYDSQQKETHEIQLCRRGSDISLDSSTGTYTLTDASDVQEVARMQEESLRLSSPITTPKRQSVTSISSRRVSVSSRSSISDLENAEQPMSFTSPLSMDSNTTEATNAFSSLTSKNSDHSSPSESPYGSNASLDSIEHRKGQPYRGSLPNLTRNMPPLKSRKNAPSHESRQQKSFVTKSSASGRKSDSNLLTGVKPRRTMPSPTRLKAKQPNRPILSTSSAISFSQSHESSKASKVTRSTARLTVKSGLPRPTRATSATRIGSGIPVPSMSSKKNSEDSWSEGCF